MRKKRHSSQHCHITLLGSGSVKVERRTLMKLTPGGNFTKTFRGTFVPKSFHQKKIQNQTVSKEKQLIKWWWNWHHVWLLICGLLRDLCCRPKITKSRIPCLFAALPKNWAKIWHWLLTGGPWIGVLLCLLYNSRAKMGFYSIPILINRWFEPATIRCPPFWVVNIGGFVIIIFNLIPLAKCHSWSKFTTFWDNVQKPKNDRKVTFFFTFVIFINQMFGSSQKSIEQKPLKDANFLSIYVHVYKCMFVWICLHASSGRCAKTEPSSYG